MGFSQTELDTVNVGAYPGDSTADVIREAFLKVNRAIKRINSLDVQSSLNDTLPFSDSAGIIKFGNDISIVGRYYDSIGTNEGDTLVFEDQGDGYLIDMPDSYMDIEISDSLILYWDDDTITHVIITSVFHDPGFAYYGYSPNRSGSGASVDSVKAWVLPHDSGYVMEVIAHKFILHGILKPDSIEYDLASDTWLDKGTYLETIEGKNIKIPDTGSVYFGDDYFKNVLNDTTAVIGSQYDYLNGIESVADSIIDGSSYTTITTMLEEPVGAYDPDTYLSTKALVTNGADTIGYYVTVYGSWQVAGGDPQYRFRFLKSELEDDIDYMTGRVYFYSYTNSVEYGYFESSKSIKLPDTGSIHFGSARILEYDSANSVFRVNGKLSADQYAEYISIVGNVISDIGTISSLQYFPDFSAAVVDFGDFTPGSFGIGTYMCYLTGGTTNQNFLVEGISNIAPDLYEVIIFTDREEVYTDHTNIYFVNTTALEYYDLPIIEDNLHFTASPDGLNNYVVVTDSANVSQTTKFSNESNNNLFWIFDDTLQQIDFSNTMFVYGTNNIRNTRTTNNVFSLGKNMIKKYIFLDNGLFLGNNIADSIYGFNSTLIGSDIFNDDGSYLTPRNSLINGWFIGSNSPGSSEVFNSLILGYHIVDNTPDASVKNSLLVGEYIGENTASKPIIHNTLAVGSKALEKVEQAQNILSVGNSSGAYSVAHNSLYVGASSGRYNHINNSLIVGSSAGISSAGILSPRINSTIFAVGANALYHYTKSPAMAWGHSAGYESEGSHVIFLDSLAGAHNVGDYVYAIGAKAANVNTGDTCIFIGINQGHNNINSGIFQLDGWDNVNPLLYGDFKRDSLSVNGILNVDSLFILPKYSSLPTSLPDGSIIRKDGSPDSLFIYMSGAYYHMGVTLRP